MSFLSAKDDLSAGFTVFLSFSECIKGIGILSFFDDRLRRIWNGEKWIFHRQIADVDACIPYFANDIIDFAVDSPWRTAESIQCCERMI